VKQYPTGPEGNECVRSNTERPHEPRQGQSAAPPQALDKFGPVRATLISIMCRMLGLTMGELGGDDLTGMVSQDRSPSLLSCHR
jgi:hypothetical protein